MKLKIDACSMFMIFLSAAPKNSRIDLFVEYPLDTPFSTGFNQEFVRAGEFSRN